MNHEQKMLDIKGRPENHQHDFYELQKCCMINGALDLAVMEAHPALGHNGGQKCDVREGPCSCGAWH